MFFPTTGIVLCCSSLYAVTSSISVAAYYHGHHDDPYFLALRYCAIALMVN